MGVNELMMDAAVKTSINITAKMFGLSPDVVTQILKAGMPAMGKAMQENPEMAKKLYKAEYQAMPPGMQEFYKNLAEDESLQKATAEQYSQVFGAMTDSINRVSADDAKVESKDAGKVLGASLPAITKAATADAPADEDEAGFAKRVTGALTS